MKKKVSRIPKFRNKEEEAKFWDTHSFADYWDEFKDINLVIELNKPKEKTIIVRLQKGLKDKLAKIAKSKGLNMSSLARLWLMEKIQSSH